MTFAFVRQAIAGLMFCLFLNPLSAFATLWWDNGANNGDWGASYQSGGQNYATNWSIASSGGVDPLFSALNGNRFVFNVSSLNSSQTINLNANRNTGNLQFLSSAAVTINSGSGDNLLTIQGGAMPDVVGAPGAPGVVGILVDSNAGVATLNSRVRISGDQDWRVRSGRNLNVSGSINLQSYDLTVTGEGTTSISSNIFGSTTDSLIKREHGELILSGNSTYSGGTTIYGGRLAVDGSIMGPVTINANGTLGGNGTIHGAVAGVGKVAPGNSPGILMIDGDYTQTTNSTLEIEIGGTMVGTQHDKLIVTGAAALAGRLEVPLSNGYVPAIDTEIEFLTAGGGVSGQFTALIAPNLQAVNNANGTNLAFVAIYGPNNVRLRAVPKTSDVLFSAISQQADWSAAGTWLNGTPDLPNVVGITNLYNGAPQTLNVDIPDAKVNELSVTDAADPITINVQSGQALTAQTAISIGGLGFLQLQTGSAVNAADVDVQAGGLLAGNGQIRANRVTVSGGTLRPGFSVGQLDVTGDYEQSSSGTLLVDIESATQHDTLTITGEAQLGGTLQIDTSQLTTVPTAGTLIPLVTADSITGNFASIEATGNNNVYFLSKIIASGTNTIAYAESFDRGDMNGDTAIDDIDYDLFAFGLMNRSTSGYQAKCNCDILPQESGDFSGNGRLDFDDIAGFQSQLSGRGLSSAALFAAIDRYANSVPEPHSAVLFVAGVVILGSLFRRGPKWN